MAASRRMPGMTRRNCRLGWACFTCTCLTCGIAKVSDINALPLCELFSWSQPWAHQGMCFTTPKRINNAATKAARTAQVSHEILLGDDFSDFLSSVASGVIISFSPKDLGDGFRLPRHLYLVRSPERFVNFRDLVRCNAAHDKQRGCR